MQEKRPQKILIIRFSSIGDLVLTTPVVRGLRTRFPDAEIHYLTKITFKNIISANPYVNRFHFYKGSLKKTLKALRAEKFDVVVDLQRNFKTWRIRFALGVENYTFNKLNFEKWMLVNFKRNRLPDKHIVDRYYEALEPLGVVNDNKGLDFFSIHPVDEVSLTLLPEKFRNGYVAFVIGGTYSTKKLTNKKIISICKKIEEPIVLLGGSKDLENGTEIKRAVGERIYNAVNKFGVAQSASLLKQSRYVISHDTGLMHMAAAMKLPVVSVWGNTIPEFGMTPYYGDPILEKEMSTIVEVKGLGCRPCSKLGFRKCPKGHFKCILDIDEMQIVNAITSRLGTNPQPGNQ